MPADQPRQPNRAWRQATPGPVPAAGGRRAWQQGGAQPTGPKKPWSKKAKLGFGLGALGVIVVLLVIVILMLIPAKPACLIGIGSDYAENVGLPANLYGWKALEDLAELADKSGTMRVQHSPQQLDDSTTWKRLWENISKKFVEKTAIIYLALHGAADTSGPYLLLNAKGQERILIKQILHDLSNSPELKDKQIVLILDATQVPADVRSGLLHNDFARKLRELQEQIEAQENLVVLCASDVNERSWPSEEWQGTIFGHYVVEGLKGAADSDKNSRITAHELHEYVQRKVKAWAQANRNAAQTPFMLGSKARAESIELVQIKEAYTETAPELAPGGSFSYPTELQAAWERWQELRTQVPSPAVYTPQLWRRYQDTLVRYEQLVRAGEATKKAPAVKQQLEILGREIDKARRLDVALASATNTSALPATLGLASPWSDEQLRNLVRDLWNAKTAEARASAQEATLKLVKTAGSEELGKRLLSLQLGKELVQHIVEQRALSHAELLAPLPDTRLAKGRLLLEHLDKRNSARAVETQYLDIVLQDVDAQSPPPVARIQQALQVRLLAEQAALASTGEPTKRHSYSEVVLPWIRHNVEDADKDRRRGEDWLLGSNLDAQTKAAEQLGSARQKYDAARSDARILQEALATRDRLFAELPYYAEWLARQRLVSADEQHQRRILALMDAVESLSRTLTALRERLDVVDPRPDVLRHLQKLSRQLRDEFDGTKDQPGIREHFRTICERLPGIDHQNIWHDLEAALACPLIEDLKQRVTLTENSRRRSSKLNTGDVKLAAGSGHPDETHAKDAAQRNKRMAQVVLSLSGHKQKPADPDDGPWHQRMAAAGEQIAKSWQQCYDDIRKGFEANQKSGKLEDAVRELKSAEHLCRLVSGSAGSPPADSPVEALRRLRMHDLFIWQARRTIDDYYFDDFTNPATTYYVRAARDYLADAKKLVELSADADLTAERQALARSMEKTDAQLTRLVAAGDKTKAVTTQRQFPVQWTLTKEGKAIDGVPMVWLELRDRLQSSNKDLPRERKPLKDGLPAKVTYQLTKAPENGDSPVTLRMVFRGQRLSPETLVRMYEAADTVVYRFPPPKESGLAIRMKDFHYGAVSFILDCSGSMDAPYPNKNSPKKRFDYAREALEKALKTIPNETLVSLLVFVWDAKAGATDVNALRGPKAWDQRQLGDLMRDVWALKADTGTPLARALVKARDEGFLLSYKGPKVIVALTDGDDQHSFSPKPKDYNAEVRRFLKDELNGRDIEVNVIVFNDPGDKEAENAEKQFAQIKDFKPRPGRFQANIGGAALAATLEAAIRPRVRLLDGNDTLDGFPQRGVLVSPQTGNLQGWRVRPAGTYEAVVQHVLSQQIQVRDGEVLQITLKGGPQKSFERYLFGKENAQASKPAGKWDVSALQNQILQKQGQLRQLVAIEDRVVSPGKGGILRHLPPGFVWLECNAAGGKSAGQTRWFNEFLYPAPTWRVERDGWPKNGSWAAAELSVWCLPDKFPTDEDYAKSFDTIVPGNDIRVGKTSLTVQERTVEERSVSVKPGVTEVRECLVIRVRCHEADRPVFVQAQGLNTSGEEHHYYQRSGEYTAIFWGPANLQTAEYQLHVIALRDFKTKVGAAQLTVGRPTAGDSDPERLTLEDPK